MKGYIFDDVEVELDPRTAEVSGSWGMQHDGRFVAGDWYLVRFFFEQMRHHLQPIILDVGAGTGSYCLLPKFYDAKAYAFEPHPKLLPILESNIALNDLWGSVTLYPLALSNKKESVFLISPSSPDYYSLATIGNLHKDIASTSERKTYRVAATTIDELHFEHVDMIKIDVEGAEKFVLEGGESTIRGCMPDILLEWTPDSLRTKQFGYDRDEIVWLLKGWGYRYFLPVGNEDLWITRPLKLQS